MVQLTEKGFNATIKAISIGGDKLATMIHSAGLFALAQVNEHGNSGFGVRLIEAMGKKHDVKRVEKWFCHFGKFGIKSGVLVYRARRDIAPENMTAWAEKADATPYWELTEQEHHKFSFNGLAMLESIVKRLDKAKEKASAGEEVNISNESVMEGVLALLKKHTAQKVPAPLPV